MGTDTIKEFLKVLEQIDNKEITLLCDFECKDLTYNFITSTGWAFSVFTNDDEWDCLASVKPPGDSLKLNYNDIADSVLIDYKSNKWKEIYLPVAQRSIARGRIR